MVIVLFAKKYILSTTGVVLTGLYLLLITILLFDYLQCSVSAGGLAAWCDMPLFFATLPFSVVVQELAEDNAAFYAVAVLFNTFLVYLIGSGLGWITAQVSKIATLK